MLALTFTRRLFFHYIRIPPFAHLNTICILMGCSLLNLLYNFDLSFLEILFIYTIKLNKWGKFLLSPYKHPFQLITGLLDFEKGWVTRHVIVSGNWESSSLDPHGPYLQITPWTCPISLCKVVISYL